MQGFFGSFKGIAAVAVFGAMVWSGAVQPAGAQTPGGQQPAQAEKKLKDQGEYDIYNEVLKDLNPQSPNYPKAITDLDTWKQKYPDSEYKDDRLYDYVQAYNGANQPAKVLEIAQQLMQKDIKATFKDPKVVIGFLYLTSLAITRLPNPAQDQLQVSSNAARQLLDFIPSYFTAANKPAGTDDATWAKTRTDLESVPKAALMVVAVTPANQAMAKTPKDCDTAASLYEKALRDYPDNAYIAYNLGGALSCIARATPAKAGDVFPRAVYEFVRAAVTDPSLGKTADPKVISDYATRAYTNYHGSEEGLDKLKDAVKQSALPPSGFTIESAQAIATRKQNEFAQSNPQLALWMGIKSQLADPANGEQYFEGQLKNAQVPKLKGTVIEGKPACRSKELLVGVPLPDNPGKLTPEISLKLDAPLNTKAVSGTEIQWEGVPSGFTKEPFLLTMDTEKAKIEGLKTEACPVTRPPAAGAKKGAGTKKK